MKNRSLNYNMDVAIIGAGLAGLSAAYHLSNRTDFKIRIFDAEPWAGMAASGKSASMINCISEDPILAEIMARSAEGLKQHWMPLNEGLPIFNPCGSVHIGTEKAVFNLKPGLNRLADSGRKTEILNRISAVRKNPALEPFDFEAAVFCESDGVILTDRLIELLTLRLKQKGVSFRFSCPATVEFDDNHHALLSYRNRKCRARYIINAAGAWMNDVLTSNLGIRPEATITKRHLFITRPDLRFGENRFPIIWDLSKNFYLRPENKSLLMCACDNHSSGNHNCPVDPRSYEWMDRKLDQVMPEWKSLKFRKVWAGLRTFSPDKRFIIGPDPISPELHWIACLGGHGVTSAFEAGRILTDSILGQKQDEAAQACLPSRFRDCKNNLKNPVLGAGR